MAKNTEKNAKPYNVRARIKKNKEYLRVSFILNQEQQQLLAKKGIESPGTVAKKLFLRHMEEMDND